MQEPVPKVNEGSEVESDECSRLMRKVVKGDTEAFEYLYHRFCPILRHSYAKWGGDHESCDDFIQRVFTCLWEQRKNFRGESSFVTYLFSIAKHTMREKMGESRKTAGTDLQERSGFTMISRNRMSQPEVEFYLKELTAVFEAAKSGLTAKQRLALEASDGADRLCCKVSRRPDCSHEALKSRLKRARRRLREQLASVLQDG